MFERVLLALPPIIAWSAGFAGIRSTYWAAVAVCLAAFIWSVFAGYRTRQKPIAARAMEMERI